jgi:hypothetical protein
MAKIVPLPAHTKGLYEAAKTLPGPPWNALLTEAVELPKCSTVALMLALLARLHRCAPFSPIGQ